MVYALHLAGREQYDGALDGCRLLMTAGKDRHFFFCKPLGLPAFYFPFEILSFHIVCVIFTLDSQVRHRWIQ